MKHRKLAANYAGALLSILTDDQQAAQADAFLQALRQAFGQSSEFRELLRDPAAPRVGRKKVLMALAEQSGAPVAVRNFLGVLADHNRAAVLPEIAETFRQLWEQRQGIVPVTLTTAAPLGDDLRQRAQAALERRTGQRVRLDCKVDPALLGGAVARVGSRLFDGSLKTQLQQLRQHMAHD